MSVDNEAYDQSSIMVTSPSKVAKHITSNRMTISTVMIFNMLDQRFAIQLKIFKGSKFHFCLASKILSSKFFQKSRTKEWYVVCYHNSAITQSSIPMYAHSILSDGCLCSQYIPKVMGCTGHTRLGTTVTLLIIAHMSYSERCTPERKLNYTEKLEQQLASCCIIINVRQ